VFRWVRAHPLAAVGLKLRFVYGLTATARRKYLYLSEKTLLKAAPPRASLIPLVPIV
jgi:hypothetical protein